MDTPRIIVDGKTYELPRLKCVAWRKLMEFQKEHGEIFTEDFIESRCEFLAEVYGGGLTAKDLLDNLYLEEIAPAYRDVASYIVGSLSARLEEVEKNADEGDKREQLS